MQSHFNEKKNHFFQGCGEKMAITRLIIGLAPYNYFHSIFFATVVKIPAYFYFFGLKGLNFLLLTFNDQH